MTLTDYTWYCRLPLAPTTVYEYCSILLLRSAAVSVLVSLTTTITVIGFVADHPFVFVLLLFHEGKIHNEIPTNCNSTSKQYILTLLIATKGTVLTASMKPLLVSSHLSSKTTLRPLTVSEDHGNSNNNNKTGRLLLLPTARSVSVVAAATGQQVATILADKEASSIIESIALVFPGTDKRDERNSMEQDDDEENDKNIQNVPSLLLGCSDGTLREVLLSVETKSAKPTYTDCGIFAVPGTCLFPRRTWKVGNGSLCQIAVLQVSTNQLHQQQHDEDPTSATLAPTVYILVEKRHSKKNNKQRQELFKLSLPLYKPQAKTDSLKSLLVRMSKFKGKHLQDVKKLSKEPRKMKQMVPFLLLSACFQKNNYVVLVGPTSLHVYCDIQNSNQTFKGFDLTIPRHNNVMTTASVSANAAHVAVGYKSGMIQIFDDLLQHAERYLIQGDKLHPAKAVIVRKLHWHAHAVSSLEFSDSNRFLYSGGEESVLVTWQLERGTDRPAQVLPRIALGGIAHVIEMDNRALIVCQDNSMHLFNLHNQSLVWKRQGLAVASQAPSAITTTSDISDTSQPVLKYASTETIMLVGLSLAPGYMHWYDTRQQQVIRSIEIAAFNRVSRTESGETPMPSPVITHAVFSKEGDIMVTCERIPTENKAVGPLQGEGRSVFAMITTIRFWKRPLAGGDDKPFELTASMAYPHGISYTVASAGISDDGKYVCTISNDENAFRVWHQTSNIDDKTGQQQVEWLCQYKVTTPAGYARHPVGHSAVAFSSDASIIAIAYGADITLWDRSDMSLLASVDHTVERDDSQVVALQLVHSDSLTDMVLSRSSKTLTLQSPFGSNGPVNLGWTYRMPSGVDCVAISHAEFLPTQNSVAVSVYSASSCTSEIVMIDALTGEESSYAKDIPGKIISVIAKGQRERKSHWSRGSSAYASICLYALTTAGELFVLPSKDAGVLEELSPIAAGVDTVNLVPKLPLLATLKDTGNKKRAYAVIDLGAEHSTKQLKFDDEVANLEDSVTQTTVVLNRSFARSFLARHFQR